MSCCRKENLDSRLRCSRLRKLPVSRLSTPSTVCPSASRASQRCEPRKPAAPVTITRKDLGCSVGIQEVQKQGRRPPGRVFVRDTNSSHLLQPSLQQTIRLTPGRGRPAPRKSSLRQESLSPTRTIKARQTTKYLAAG